MNAILTENTRVNRKGGSVTERRRFEALCELGGKIIPFLVEKMTTKALAPAVVLCRNSNHQLTQAESCQY